jgi:hypothetical protein
MMMAVSVRESFKVVIRDWKQTLETMKELKMIFGFFQLPAHIDYVSIFLVLLEAQRTTTE